jgi:hypothetical protein
MALEQARRRRRKKLIRALESAETWRPTCSECTDSLRKKRGCKKPGFHVEQSGQPFRFTSPLLQSERDQILRECPTGYLLREAPHTFDTLEAASLVENAAPTDLRRMSRYLLDSSRIRSSELHRLHDLRRLRDKARSHAGIGSRTRDAT